tara:strand:+ start:383 stop:691 length:309 start_codon:yes stop_codon:yes gene_type:complete
MGKEDNWSEISESVTDLSKKIKDTVYEENLIDDIKDSLRETVENTSDILNTLSNTIDTRIKDEEIKKESIEIINKISEEIQGNLKGIEKKFTGNQNSLLEEE